MSGAITVHIILHVWRRVRKTKLNDQQQQQLKRQTSWQWVEDIQLHSEVLQVKREHLWQFLIPSKSTVPTVGLVCDNRCSVHKTAALRNQSAQALGKEKNRKKEERKNSCQWGHNYCLRSYFNSNSKSNIITKNANKTNKTLFPPWTTSHLFQHYCVQQFGKLCMYAQVQNGVHTNGISCTSNQSPEVRQENSYIFCMENTHAKSVIRTVISLLKDVTFTPQMSNRYFIYKPFFLS